MILLTPSERLSLPVRTSTYTMTSFKTSESVGNARGFRSSSVMILCSAWGTSKMFALLGLLWVHKHKKWCNVCMLYCLFNITYLRARNARTRSAALGLFGVLSFCKRKKSCWWIILGTCSTGLTGLVQDLDLGLISMRTIAGEVLNAAVCKLKLDTETEFCEVPKSTIFSWISVNTYTIWFI